MFADEPFVFPSADAGLVVHNMRGSRSRKRIAATVTGESKRKLILQQLEM